MIMLLRRWLSVLLLVVIPVPAGAISLHWASGTDTLTFIEARRCTLVVEVDSAEGTLPEEWRLLWVAEDFGNLVIVPDTTFATLTMAQAVSVLPPTAAETDANVITCNFRLPGSPPITAARYLLDLPTGSSGKFIVYALLPGPDGASGTLARSQAAVVNGGATANFPALVMGATGDHTTTRLSVRGRGAGLGAAASASLVAADTSWRVPLTITEATDSTLTAEAEVPTQLPDAVLQVSLADSMSAATPLPASQVMAPMVDSVTIRGNSFLVPPDSAGVSPKDFAFVYNTVPTATPGVWRGLFHLIYIRRLPNGDEFNLGHAWSPDLRNWTSDRYHFLQGPLGTWDAKHVWAPSIVQNGNLYHMFYTGVDAGGNQRIGRVTTPLLDTTNTVWSDRKMVYAADSTRWVVRHPSAFGFRDQFRDPFVFPDPDTAGRFLMVYTAMDTNYKAQLGHSVGLARNRPGTLDRWIDLSRYESTDYGHNGYLWQVESPHVIPDSGYVPPYWVSGDRPTGWRLMYTWGGNHPDTQILRVAKDTLTVNVADTLSSGWGFTQTLYSYLSADTTVRGLQASEHLKAGNVDYIAGYNAYLVDGIQISRMYWNGPNFYLRIPAVTGVDVAGASTASVRLRVLEFDPKARKVRFQIRVFREWCGCNHAVAPTVAG
ncbi:MAG: hypothetical protein HZC42_10080 [Candidatus Eisenbacteria bacterium]|nr:hypothetical protein [Candidatus Eisenbacteria bacterium]